MQQNAHSNVKVCRGVEICFVFIFRYGLIALPLVKNNLFLHTIPDNHTITYTHIHTVRLTYFLNHQCKILKW